MTSRTPVNSTRIYDSLGDDIIAGRPANRIDNQSTFFYIGDAKVGALDNELIWRIQKIDISTNPYTITWAESNIEYDKSWVNRGSYTYG